MVPTLKASVDSESKTAVLSATTQHNKSERPLQKSNQRNMKLKNKDQTLPNATARRERRKKERKQ